jgi:hypothetical protein
MGLDIIGKDIIMPASLNRKGKNMKARTMVYLESEELQALRVEAAKKGISLAELMRRLVRQHVEKRHPEPPATAKAYLKIVALGSSGRRDISVRHDHYLAEALRREHSR